MFTVVVPNLHSRIVGGTITSLLGQTLPRGQFEIVVVGQDQYGIVRTFQDVQFVETPTPRPPAAARNRGAERAQGEVLAFIDADCLAAPNWLEVLDSRFRDATVQVVGGGIAIPPAPYFSMADNLALFHEFLTTRPGGQRAHLPGLNLAIRRTAFEAAGGFDEHVPHASGEDTEFTARLRRLGFRLEFEPRAVATHHSRRIRMTDLVQRGHLQGRHSIKVDPRFQGTTHSLPGVLHHRTVLLAMSPALGLGAACRIYLADRSTWRLWYLFPAVLLSRMAWVAGAASALP
jgi:glycosyltransferase involved in cell wall biosynthesis